MKFKLKVIKKTKAFLVGIKIHYLLGWSANLLIYIGYLLKMSKWIDNNKKHLIYNDFYNGNVKHSDRFKLYEFVADHYSLDQASISYLEFGVGYGNSLKWWSAKNTNAESEIWAFDTFVGLPEKYGHYEIGIFDQGGKFPQIDDDRINFVKGLFQDTLLDVLSNIDFTKKTMVHVDGDLYTSALFNLTVLIPYLKKGDLILFDEFGVPAHEFKAFDDVTKSFNIKLKPIGAINNYLQLVFEVE